MRVAVAGGGGGGGEGRDGGGARTHWGSRAASREGQAERTARNTHEGQKKKHWKERGEKEACTQRSNSTQHVGAGENSAAQCLACRWLNDARVSHSVAGRCVVRLLGGWRTGCEIFALLSGFLSDKLSSCLLLPLRFGGSLPRLASPLPPLLAPSAVPPLPTELTQLVFSRLAGGKTTRNGCRLPAARGGESVGRCGARAWENTREAQTARSEHSHNSSHCELAAALATRNSNSYPVTARQHCMSPGCWCWCSFFFSADQLGL